MNGEVLFLGTGGSHGIPMIGCDCAVCTSSDPNNNRMRPSALLEIRGKRILLDAGPDLRFQALRFGVREIDGVIITHTHFDHIGGLDELRTYYLLNKKRVPLLLSSSSYEELKLRLPYLFQQKMDGISLAAQLDFHILKEKEGSVTFLDIPFTHMTYEQGGMEVKGFRVGGFAYVSDIKKYEESVFEKLSGVKLLILSALRESGSPMHFSINEAVAFARKVGAEATYFTHMAHEVDHAQVSAMLPQGIHLAYDGLKLQW